MYGFLLIYKTDMLGIFVKPNPKAFKKDVLSAERRVAASACLKERQYH